MRCILPAVARLNASTAPPRMNYRSIGFCSGAGPPDRLVSDVAHSGLWRKPHRDQRERTVGIGPGDVDHGRWHAVEGEHQVSQHVRQPCQPPLLRLPCAGPARQCGPEGFGGLRQFRLPQLAPHRPASVPVLSQCRLDFNHWSMVRATDDTIKSKSDWVGVSPTSRPATSRPLTGDRTTR